MHNIHIQFPNHHYSGPVLVNDESLEADLDLMTTFHVDDPIDKTLEPIMGLLAEFYQFGADYFEKGKLSGDDVAAKLRMHLGEIWLGNRAKSNFSYHFIGVWPHSVNFGKLCFSSDPSFDLEITWRYQKCELCDLIAFQG